MLGANIKTEKLHRELKKRGWSVTRTEGGHDVYEHPDAQHHIAVPRHTQLKPPLVIKIFKQMTFKEDNQRLSFSEFTVLVETLCEAEYQGHQVQLNKPMKGDVKKSKVFVKDPSTGNIIKVNFGDKNLSIKKHIPARRKAFRARHNCADATDKTTPRYWSCKAW